MVASDRRRTVTLLMAAALGAQLAMPPIARAGGGPESVLLVVNSTSWASQSVANHYIRLRQIPARNVLYLDWDGGLEAISVDDLRAKILEPILRALEQRGLSSQIDYVVYSADFPCSVSLAGDLNGQQAPPQLAPTGSLTGLTYLAQWVIAKNSGAIGLRTNQYMRACEDRQVAQASHGFHSWYGWGPGGELLEAGGQHYLLSTMLAVTSGRGNSVREAVDYLGRSAAADGRHPKGTIYFMQSDDVRAKTRQWGFAGATADLKKLGVAAEVIDGALPTGKSDVQGVLIGVADFSWGGSHSRIKPGALCEHLTSYGGAMEEGNGQTPLSELLRYGAAGASGTVVEPYAMQDKFPVPAVQVHYARGCTLAEAFYQSVFGPYQLLIVGDPLCRPWANIPTVSVKGVNSGEKVSGKLSLAPHATTARGSAIDRFEVYVDGQHWRQHFAGDSLELDTSKLADGYHELRFVAIEPGPIESQGRLIVPIHVDNQGGSVEVTSSRKTFRWGQTLQLSVKAPGMAGVAVFHNGRSVGTLAGEEGEVTIDTRRLGMGPVTLCAFGISSGGTRKEIAAAPLEVSIEPATPLAGLKEPDFDKLARGLEIKLADGKIAIAQETRDPNWLATAGVKPNEAFELSGYFQVVGDDTYQFQVQHRGELEIAVDDRPFYSEQMGTYTQKYLPVRLSNGLHHVKVSGKSGGQVQLRLLFGGPGSRSLTGAAFRHAQ